MENISVKTADDILKSPTLLDDFIADTERLGHRGERAIKIITLLSFLSCRKKKPISVLVQGESSSGKNSMVDSVKEFVPDEYVIDLSSVTAAALWNLPTSAVKHKAIFIAEKAGSSGADYPIRTFQSEGKLSRFCSVPTESGGWVTKEQKIEGPCAFIQTTTSVQSDRNAENETRTFVLYSDDSEDLTRQVLDAQKEQYRPNGSVVNRASLCKEWKEAFKLLKPMRVIIPYIEGIKFPTNPVRVRRDHSRFLSLIELSAHVHQFQREHIKQSSEDVIIADSKDYRFAYDHFVPLMLSNVDQISPKLKELCEMLRNSPNKIFTYSSAAALTHWNRKTVMKYVDEGLKAGCFDVPKGIKTGVTSEFNVLELSKNLARNLFISTPDEIDTVANLPSCPNGLVR